MPTEVSSKLPQASQTKQPFTKRLLRHAHSREVADAIYAEKIKHKPLILYSAPKVSTKSSAAPSNLSSSTRRSSSGKDARDLRREARNAKLEAQQRRRSKKPQPLSARDKRRLCIYEMTKEERKYSIYLGLHRLWCEYMRGILGLGEPQYESIHISALPSGIETPENGGSSEDSKAVPPEAINELAVTPRSVNLKPQTVGPLLTSADFHGADLEVVRSRCISRVGVRGIVVRDTKFTFEVITKSNEIKARSLVLPKEHSVFRFSIPVLDAVQAPPDAKLHASQLVFELYGEQFKNRAPDRAKKQPKIKISPDL